MNGCAMSRITIAKVTVTGRVQGVFFRQSTRDKARSLGLAGWVRNTDEGSVELEARGPKDSLEELIAWCRTGPPAASVAAVEIEWREDEDRDSETHPHFQITY